MVDNKNFYNKVWKKTKIRESSDYPEWSILKKWIKNKNNLLEIGPGTRPRLPIEKSMFLDISETAVNKLNEIRSGCALLSDLNPLPFLENSHELICAFDVIEHVEDDQKLLNEISRILSKEGLFVFSIPLHQKYYDKYDEYCGHYRRYGPSEIEDKLKKANLKIVGVSKHGLRSKNKIIDNLGVICLKISPKLSAQLSEVFYTRKIKKTNKNFQLKVGNTKKHLNEFYSALIVAQKASI